MPSNIEFCPHKIEKETFYTENYRYTVELTYPLLSRSTKSEPRIRCTADQTRKPKTNACNYKQYVFIKYEQEGGETVGTTQKLQTRRSLP